MMVLRTAAWLGLSMVGYVFTRAGAPGVEMWSAQDALLGVGQMLFFAAGSLAAK